MPVDLEDLDLPGIIFPKLCTMLHIILHKRRFNESMILVKSTRTRESSGFLFDNVSDTHRDILGQHRHGWQNMAKSQSNHGDLTSQHEERCVFSRSTMIDQNVTLGAMELFYKFFSSNHIKVSSTESVCKATVD